MLHFCLLSYAVDFLEDFESDGLSNLLFSIVQNLADARIYLLI